MGILKVVVVLAGLLFLFAPPWGWIDGDNTWRARIVSVDGDVVCTTPDEGERDPGWSDPLCFEGNFESRGGEAVAAQVGTCVDIESVHPTFFVQGVVECR